MNKYFSNETNVQILMSLLHQSNIRKIIVSPGSTNFSLVASLQRDDFFEMYSCLDERSAAYMACGLAAETGEVVVLSCTGATASRNYLPALTEAYYRKLPILAITSTQYVGRIGQNIPQVIDRSSTQNDVFKSSYYIPTVLNSEQAWEVNVKINQAIVDLFSNGGGPVHLNLETNFDKHFDAKILPKSRKIDIIRNGDDLPVIACGKVAVFVGEHSLMQTELVEAIDEFCRKYNAVVICDHTSNYDGKYGVLFSLITNQKAYESPYISFDQLISIGNISGAYMSLKVKEEWRVSQDHMIRDARKKTRLLFLMDELNFFRNYNAKISCEVSTSLFENCKNEYQSMVKLIPDIPFSNILVAQKLLPSIPEGSTIHLGILNSLRAANLFEKSKSVSGFANVGGFGIDGCLSSLVGASLAHQQKLYFCILGDLAFYYDMNALGNRHIGANLRIAVINNNGGTEFRNYTHFASEMGQSVDEFVAAGNHFMGTNGKSVVKEYVEALGFKYFCATNKEEFLDVLPIFSNKNYEEKSIVLEIIVNSEDESKAWLQMNNLKTSNVNIAEQNIKKVVKQICSENTLDKIREIRNK